MGPTRGCGVIEELSEVPVQSRYDVVVVGAGPNGLTAAALLARSGLETLVVEAAPVLGGGLRTEELTLPGFSHDVCSAVHTMGCVSPVFSELQLEGHGLQWIYPECSVAHPFDDGPAAVLHAEAEQTLNELGVKDGRRLRRILGPFLELGAEFFPDLLAPLHVPKHPLALARFAFYGLRSATVLSGLFEGKQARALFGGCAAHAIQPLDHWLTSAIGLALMGAGAVRPWPVARGGSAAIARALETVGLRAGVEYVCGLRVSSLEQLPQAKAYLFDLAPAQVADLAGERLPNRYRRALRRYRMGPGVFKVDYALAGSIPWRDARCQRASTVHLGGTIEEIAVAERQMWEGTAPERPFVLVAQQSELDPSRAPVGMHTGYAYCHVPPNCPLDMTSVIERQIERYAPGFRDLVLARHVWSPRALEAHNPAYIGGAITGGVADARQLFTRPTWSLEPYATPNPQLFICSQATPPGGGVHGMCGYHAAKLVSRRVFGRNLPG